MPEQARSGRRAQQKAVTRAALVSAGQTLLAEGRTDVSIREITSLAGVGFGSFFNYFESKDDLYEAAFEAALTTYGRALDALVGPIGDPAEAVAVGLRVTGRLQRLMPHEFRVLLSRGTLLTLQDRGFIGRFEELIAAGNATGQFTCPDLSRSSLAVGGAMMGLLVLLDSDATLDAALEADKHARRSLMSLEVPAGEAERLVALALPRIPTGLDRRAPVVVAPRPPTR